MSIQSTETASFIKKLRLEKGISQESLAESIGVSERHYRAIETAERGLPLEVIFKISVALGMKPNTIIDFVWKDWLESNPK